MTDYLGTSAVNTLIKKNRVKDVNYEQIRTDKWAGSKRDR